ncbi:restriction endonuclease [Campylobacter jejuni]|uniref:AAA domain-containing protein n=3 Tax=Campylobacter jejuni TaxID=197 RepID=A0A5Y8W894_CAMJU|nr:restriction endonuclease [Campylobacter jejuni]EAJ8384509.1 restriction endonuclease [Campylobacter jejuni]EAK7990585.1 restriction endonuclease [Campylobacter jejuni]EAK8177343.1 restriction endonuclease [Campylobacter jejuni]EAL0104967.1 restriction endonuclease [Campylobacter jejuni]
MLRIFSENNKKEIQDIFKKMIELAIKFYNDRNSTFKDAIEDIQNFFKSYGWKFYTGLQTLQKDKYKGFAIYKDFEEDEYIKFKKSRSAWHGIYIWFGVSRDDIYMRIVAKEEDKCNALFKIQKDNILDYKFEEKIAKFEEIKDKLFDIFLFLSNYINNLSKDDFKIIKGNSIMENNLFLNQILYGPPGTGKTYHTIDKALEIISKVEKIELPDENNRVDRKKLFNEYVKNGQIVFTTFHQSYGYEEFVEGIKPRMDKENSKEIEYEIKDGIFKELCEKALENRDSIKNFNFYIDKLKEKVKIDDNNPEKYFELPNTKYSIQYRNGRTFRIKFDGMSKNHKDYPVSIDNIEKLYKTSIADEIYNSAYVKAILNYLKSQGLEDYKEKDEKTNSPYIIIIDEINRGNVSKIFGELITLIEPSKRIGEPEELRVTLPYSRNDFYDKKGFGVPSNVYIIGTMNTADRSITSLDTALRRRFEFVEMMPNPNVLSDNCEDVNLKELLKAINTRIEYLLDREKTIGHAFFIDIDNLEKLKDVFQNKIIPLLQEYFYNDYALINMVLNDNGMIFEDKKDDKYLQKIKNLYNVDNERNIYSIVSFDNEIWNKIEIYQAIYDDEIANRLKNKNE